MAKNVIVLDEFNEQIGLTYPKRARGLVKNGRAEYVGDCDEQSAQPLKIRLTSTQVRTENFKEESSMSNIISFNAREFKFDETCESRAGQRIFVSDPFGKSVESFEIGDKEWTWTQIKRDVKLEKNTDYIFRFAVMGGACKGYGEVATFVLVPRVSASDLNDEKISQSDWEERYNYALGKIAPATKVNTPNGQFSFFEIDFNSGDCEIFTLMFIAQQTVMNIMPACELEEYSKLEKSVDEASVENQNIGCNGAEAEINLSGAALTMDAYNKAIELASKGISVNLSGMAIDY